MGNLLTIYTTLLLKLIFKKCYLTFMQMKYSENVKTKVSGYRMLSILWKFPMQR